MGTYGQAGRSLYGRTTRTDRSEPHLTHELSPQSSNSKDF